MYLFADREQKHDSMYTKYFVDYQYLSHTHTQTLPN